MEPGTWLIQVATGMQYVVNVTTMQDDMIHFNACAWVAYTGRRLGQFLREGPDQNTEIEICTPGGFNRGAMVGFWRWPHEMPEKDQ